MTDKNLKWIAEQSVACGRENLAGGSVARYIPELSKADPTDLGLCIYTIEGEKILCGKAEKRFTIQSISKVISLALALKTFGFDGVFSRVMMEPSGDAFNSIIKLDMSSERPFNPMINCGAIEVASLVEQKFEFSQALEFSRMLCMDPDITVNETVYRSEWSHGDRNRAIGYLLSSKGVLTGNVERCVDFYIKFCSLNVNAVSLAGLGLILANDGIDPYTGVRLLESRIVRTIKALMFTCGMYDSSGEFAVRVGIPAKSGVGGGIMACAEGRMGIGCYGPALDQKGNSVGGVKMLQALSDALGLHVFGKG